MSNPRMNPCNAGNAVNAGVGHDNGNGVRHADGVGNEVIAQAADHDGQNVARRLVAVHGPEVPQATQQ